MITNELKQKNHKFRKEILSYLNMYPSGEKFLIAFLISRLSDFSPFYKYPYIYNFEYFVEPPNYSQYGKGDLILTSGRKYYLVMEAKYLRQDSGKAAKKSRNNARNVVESQAEKYARILKRQNPTFIVNYTNLTNDKSWRNEHPEFAEVFHEFQSLKMKEWKQKHLY